MNSYELAQQNFSHITDELMQSKENYIKFLEFDSRMYSHSFSDSVLVYRQNPNASRVAELRDWNAVGRYVRKGEHSIVSFADSGSKCKYLFDVSQTQGKSEPSQWRIDADIAERIKEKLMLDNEDKELKALASEHQNTVYEIRLSFYDLVLYLITGICLIFLPTVFLSKQNIISGVR